MKKLKTISIENELEEVYKNIEIIIESTNIEGMEKLYHSLLHHFSVKGKLLRPSIMILVNIDFGGNFANILPFATALELIHNYSLIHDDLPSMDNDDYRRGQLTVHKKFGEDTAILTGDYLLNKAFEIALEKNTFNSFENTILATKVLAKNASNEGMLGGQFMDLNPDFLNNKDNILNMYDKKTSALFKSAFIIPGIIAGLGDDSLYLLGKLGHLFGMYFQIIDDFGDIEQDKEAGKITLLSVIDKDSVLEIIENIKKEIYNSLKILNLKYTKELIDIIDYEK